MASSPPEFMHVRDWSNGLKAQEFRSELKYASMRSGFIVPRFSQRIFLLSPAYAGGQRARMIMSERAQFDLAKRFQSREGATIAEVFTFLSGLYFRGKIAYANAFACVENGICGSFVITPTRGLVDAQTRISLDDLREFA